MANRESANEQASKQTMIVIAASDPTNSKIYQRPTYEQTNSTHLAHFQKVCMYFGLRRRLLRGSLGSEHHLTNSSSSDDNNVCC